MQTYIFLQLITHPLIPCIIISILMNRKGLFTSNQQQPSEGKYITDLIKLRFKQNNILSINGKHLCTVPQPCHQQLLSAVRLVPLNNRDRMHVGMEEQANKNRSHVHNRQQEQRNNLIKIGDLFYIEFYFISQFLHYDPYNKQLQLSPTQKTIFKAIQHIHSIHNIHSQRDQIYDYIGNLAVNQFKYQIVLADQPLYLKYSEQSVYIGAYDDRTVLAFQHSLFKIDKFKCRQLLNHPCRLYSIQENKYVRFDCGSGEMGLTSEETILLGLCRFQLSHNQEAEVQSPTLPLHRKKSKAIEGKMIKNIDKIRLRVLRQQNNSYVSHNNHSAQKLISDINLMLPQQQKQHTFLVKFQPSFSLFKNIPPLKQQTTFNLSNMSLINESQPIQQDQQQRQQITQQLAICQMNKRGKERLDRQSYQYNIQLYSKLNQHYQIFIYSGFRDINRGHEGEKKLYLEFCEDLKEGTGKYILKEYNNFNLKKQSSKYKNILRVKFISRELLQPYIYYHQIKLNLNIYKHTMKLMKIAQLKREDDESFDLITAKLNFSDVDYILEMFEKQIQVEVEKDKQTIVNLLSQIFQMGFAEVLEELFEAVIYKQTENNNEDQQQTDFTIKYKEIQTIKFIINLLKVIIKIIPSTLVQYLLISKNALLFIRINEFQQIFRSLAAIQTIKTKKPSQLLSKIQKTIQYLDLCFPNSKAKTISILWGFRIAISHNITSKIIKQQCNRLLSNLDQTLSDDYLVILQLTRLVKGDPDYRRQIVNKLPLCRIQQEDVAFYLRHMYVSHILSINQKQINLPFNLQRISKLYKKISYGVGIQKQNKNVIMAYLQDVLAKSIRFETIQNKILALEFVKLYLLYNEGAQDCILINQQERLFYLPALIHVLDELLTQYEEEYDHRFNYVMQVMKCLYLAVGKYMRDLVWREMENGMDDVQKIVRNCMKDFDKISCEKRKKLVNDFEETELHSRVKSIKNGGKHQSRTKVFLNKLLRKQQKQDHNQANLINCIDKQFIWNFISSTNKNSKVLRKFQKLQLFQLLFDISCMFLSPKETLSQLFYSMVIADDHHISPAFVDVLASIVRQDYIQKFQEFVQKIGSFQQFTSNDWAVLISVVHQNKLLKHFILFKKQQPKSPQLKNIAKLYKFLTALLKNYINFQPQQPMSPPNQFQNILQITSNIHHSHHQCQAQSFLQLLPAVEPTYIKQQIELHTLIIETMGVIIDVNHYEYYEQYVLRYQVRKYTFYALKLVEVFMKALPTTLRVSFANNYQYSLFKQGAQLRELICAISGIKQDEDSNSKKQQIRQNFNILTDLHQNQSQNSNNWSFDNKSPPQILTQLFYIQQMVQTSSSNLKQLITQLKYSLLYQVTLKYYDHPKLVISIVTYATSSIIKVINLRLSSSKNEDAANQYQEMVNQEEQILEYQKLIEWIKITNSFCQNELKVMRKINFSRINDQVVIKLIQTLLQVVKLRKEVANLFISDQEDKKYDKTDSDLPSSLSESVANSSRKLSSAQDDEIGIEMQLYSQQSHPVNRTRYLSYYNQSTNSINQNQIGNVQGINRLLCYELAQKLQGILNSSNITHELYVLLIWLEGVYKINLNNFTTATNLNTIQTQQNKVLYKFDKTYLYHYYKENNPTQRQTQTYPQPIKLNSYSIHVQFPQYELITSFIQPKVENYLVLMIELLQRLIVTLHDQCEQASKYKHFKVDYQLQAKIVKLLDVIQVHLNRDTLAYQQSGLLDMKNTDSLPKQYQNMHQMDGDDYKQKYNQKCCKIQDDNLSLIFKLLLVCHSMNRHNLVCRIHHILQIISFYNIKNQQVLQTVIQNNYNQYFEVIYLHTHTFQLISPIVKDSYFTYYSAFDKKQIFWNNLHLSQEKDYRVQNKRQLTNTIINARGIKQYHMVALNFYSMIKMLISVSKTLNFRFKQLFARPTIDKECILIQVIYVLKACVHNLTHITQQKLQFIRLLMKIINTLLRGPIQCNIQIAVNQNLKKILVDVLQFQYDKNQALVQGNLGSFINIDKLMTEALFIIIPYIDLDDKLVQTVERGLRESYIHFKKHYTGNFQDIIINYTQRKQKNNFALLYFDLALNYFYCLIEIYNKKGVDTIKQVHADILCKKKNDQDLKNTWKALYQLFNIFADIFNIIFKKITNTYEDYTDQKDQNKLLNRAIFFFSNNVSNIDVRVANKLERISFLLLKQSKCNDMSIKRQFHRLIGKHQRTMRLHNFMSISKYIIMRLEIEKEVRKIIQNFKPLQIIIVNRQLWKSLNFFFALLLNILFIFQNFLSIKIDSIYEVAIYVVRSFSFLFITFLVLVYIVQRLPLKIKIYNLTNKSGFKISSLWIILNDKTLGFIIFYATFISLSFYNLAFCSILMIDYFFRFKQSSRVTYMLIKSIKKIIYVILFLYTLIYISSLLALNINSINWRCDSVFSCIQQQFSIYMNYNLNLHNIYDSTQDLFTTILMIPRFIIKSFNWSLLIGILYIQKRKHEQKIQERSHRIQDICFICDHTRNQIDRMKCSNKGFYDHVEMEHNLWNYIYYLIYLKNKERKNLNTIESMIFEQWENNQIQWLPDSIMT